MSQILTPRKSLNKAFLKVKPHRSEIETFKSGLRQLLDRADDRESEEFHKNLVISFLKQTYYDPDYFINTKGRNDLVIHNGKRAKTPVGVIIEAKSPRNKQGMPGKESLNCKAMQELLLYYLRERIQEQNLEIKHLIATNLHEWYIFNAQLFEKYFAQNKELVRQFKDFENGRLGGNSTEFFYREIAAPAIRNVEASLKYTFVQLEKYQKLLRQSESPDDKKLVALFKIFSPEHLLKLPFANDSNTLNKDFYAELLHIIGLQQTKKGSKKVIRRKKQGERNSGSLLENAILQLDSLDKVNRLSKPNQFGENREERLLNVGLELVITWLNRILFLKLLEAQLLSYHQGEPDYAFLDIRKIHNYDDLNSLFFLVLARKHSERPEEMERLFKKIPYLNSSLFDPSDLEHETLFISNLRDDRSIPIYDKTVLRNEKGKRLSGEMNTLAYFFSFLNAYDFSSESGEDIQEENKALINASVLGLIFEKINGYKDGSFFTPGFITMYMCRETIRRAVVQKFNEVKGWDCENTDEIYDRIEAKKEARQEANEIINSLKICDPAVGSGHFLVSALNELIAIKNDLRILQDRKGSRLKEYQLEVVNDELIITDEEGELFEYHPASTESQRVQETLFHEKQDLIENCLFGVDINANSVKICRLRLWIELLKNAYYNEEGVLETLPNIDINIKCGNSLISRFELDAKLDKALRKSKWNIESYRLAVDTYRNAENKAQKREMQKLINDIKSDFRTEIAKTSKEQKDLDRFSSKLYEEFMAPKLLDVELSAKEKKKKEKKRKNLEQKIENLKQKIEEIRNSKIYDNAFEWRFEFPEVLNDEGDYVGFDVVIGNPPYVRQEEIKEFKSYFKKRYDVYNSTADLLTYFVELSYQILRNQGVFQFIISNKFTRAKYGFQIRTFMTQNTNLTHYIDLSGVPVFDEATVDASILGFTKADTRNAIIYVKVDKDEIDRISFNNHISESSEPVPQKSLKDTSWVFYSPQKLKLKEKVEKQGVPLESWDITINRGILTGFNQAFIIDTEKKNELVAKDPKSSEILWPLLRGRDIQKYYPTVPGLWLVGSHNGFNETNRIDINQFPAIKDHLDQYSERLEKRYDQGDTRYNLRNCAYWIDFLKPKIIYPELTKFLNFTLDLEDHFYTNNKNFILTGQNLYWLVAFFNSKLWRFCFRDNFPELQGGTRELRKVFFEKIPVKQISKEEELPFKEKIEEILRIKKQDRNGDISGLIEEVDEMVYEVYELCNNEIDTIKKNESDV